MFASEENDSQTLISNAKHVRVLEQDLQVSEENDDQDIEQYNYIYLYIHIYIFTRGDMLYLERLTGSTHNWQSCLNSKQLAIVLKQ